MAMPITPAAGMGKPSPHPQRWRSTRSAAAGGPLDTLSEREREVLVLVAEGHTSQQIADRLFLSVKTIESHKQSLKTKLSADSPAQLVRLAVAWFGDAP